MTDPLITMAEQPSQASCKEFHGCALPHPTARSLKTAKRGIGVAFQRPSRIPRLRPRIQTKVALQVSMPGFAVAGMQADPTTRLVAKQRRSPLAPSMFRPETSQSHLTTSRTLLTEP